MKALVTGGAGFIGSNLVETLLADGHDVTCLDNFNSGHKGFVKTFEANKSFKLVQADLLDLAALEKAVKGQDMVWHLAANGDIRRGPKQPRLDLEQNVIGTWNVLEAMRRNNVKKLVFSSSSSIYGEAEKLPVPESYAPYFPTSLYGASKVADEAFIAAYCNLFGLQAWMFRFANVVGKNGTHGVILDFIAKLRKNPRELEILGDGDQSKSFIHVSDVINAIRFVVKNDPRPLSVYNLGSEDWIKVKRIADLVCEEMGLKNVAYRFTGGKSGWPGDIPKCLLDIGQVKKLGYAPKYNSEQAVRMAIKALLGP